MPSRGEQQLLHTGCVDVSGKIAYRARVSWASLSRVDKCLMFIEINIPL